MDPAQLLQQFGPLIAVFGIFYFLIIRPQQKRDKDRRNMLSSLISGDEIVTVGGIYGRILNIKEDVITLDVGDKIKIKVTKTAVGSIVKKSESDS